MLLYVTNALQQMAVNANVQVDAALLAEENTGAESTEAARETDDLARAPIAPGATGREYLEQMERQLQADNPARAQATQSLERFGGSNRVECDSGVQTRRSVVFVLCMRKKIRRSSRGPNSQFCSRIFWVAGGGSGGGAGRF